MRDLSLLFQTRRVELLYRVHQVIVHSDGREVDARGHQRVSLHVVLHSSLSHSLLPHLYPYHILHSFYLILYCPISIPITFYTPSISFSTAPSLPLSHSTLLLSHSLLPHLYPYHILHSFYLILYCPISTPITFYTPSFSMYIISYCL